MLPNNIIGVEVSMLSSKCGRLDNDWVKTCYFNDQHYKNPAKPLGLVQSEHHLVDL
jgi:hypothetical protein